MPLRIVIDTCVVVSACRSRNGASRGVLDLIAARLLTPLATPALFLQYEAVLKRPEQQAVSGLTLPEIDRLLAALADAIEPVTVHYAWRPQLSDPDDEIVLDAAANGRADALVTHNIRDFRSAASRFGINLLRPVEILREALR